MGSKGCGTINKNGERLADRCCVSDLITGGTVFQLTEEYIKRHGFHQMGGPRIR